MGTGGRHRGFDSIEYFKARFAVAWGGAQQFFLWFGGSKLFVAALDPRVSYFKVQNGV